MAESKIAYLVRHGESVDNRLPIFQSDNSVLSEKGRHQADKIARRLSTVSFEALISSPVQRARETAGYIAARTGKNLEQSPLFRERVLPRGLYGKPWTDEEAHNMWRLWDKSLYTPGMHVSDGENYDNIVERADAALKFLLDRPEASSAVVTHGYFLRAMVARAVFGDDLNGAVMWHFQEQAPMENTGITTLHYKPMFEGGNAWQLSTYNDHSHLLE